MKNQLERRRADYGPQCQKTFTGALESFFANECPQLGGTRSRQVLVQGIHEMVRDFFPATDHLHPGQIGWTCVHKDAFPARARRISETQLQHVSLDLVPQSDMRKRADGANLRDLKIEAVARLFTQAYEQDGVLTSAEVAIMLKICDGSVRKYVKIWEEENQARLPRRGTIHDMGPTLTHKREIIEKLVFEGKSVETVCRETHHSPEAVLRYTVNFRQVLLCLRKKLDPTETSYITRLSISLIEEYLGLIQSWEEKYPNFEAEQDSDYFEGLVDNLNKITSNLKGAK